MRKSLSLLQYTAKTSEGPEMAYEKMAVPRAGRFRKRRHQHHRTRSAVTYRRDMIVRVIPRFFFFSHSTLDIMPRRQRETLAILSATADIAEAIPKPQ